MEPSSTRTTSSVTGGSTLTVLKLRVFTASAPQGSYASPDSAPIGGYDAPAGVIEDAQAAYGQAARNARNGRGPEVPFTVPSNPRRPGRRNGRQG